MPGNSETFLQMTFKFIERCFQINRNSQHKQDAIVITKIIIALLENLQGRIDDALPFIIQTCTQELLNNGKGKLPKNVKSMLLQTLCMSFWYNSQLTFHIME